jgi:hypothetical protein
MTVEETARALALEISFLEATTAKRHAFKAVWCKQKMKKDKKFGPIWRLSNHEIIEAFNELFERVEALENERKR